MRREEVGEPFNLPCSIARDGIMNVEVLALIEISRDQISSSVVQFKQLALDINSCVYYANLKDYKLNEMKLENEMQKNQIKTALTAAHTRSSPSSFLL